MTFLAHVFHARDVATKLIAHARSSPIPPPWDEAPPWAQLLHDEDPGGLSRFHRVDVWHTFHMGVGKSYLASCVSMVQHLTGESSVDKRVEAMSVDFLDWCANNKKTKYLKKLEPSTFALKSREPHGSWNKAHVTSTLMEWLSSFLDKHRETCQSDVNLRLIAS